MRPYELVAALVVIVAVAAFFRFQYNHVAGEVTSDDPKYDVIPVVTPISSPLCTKTPDSSCLIPTVTPIFPKEKPSRGLSVP